MFFFKDTIVDVVSSLNFRNKVFYHSSDKVEAIEEK